MEVIFHAILGFNSNVQTWNNIIKQETVNSLLLHEYKP